MGSLPEKNIKITFLTDAPFIVKFRFEKYRYLLTYLLCTQIFEAPLSHNHSTGPQNVSAAFNCHCSSECVCCLLPVLSDDTHFVPKYMMKVKLIKYWMPNILSEQNYTLGKWGTRKAFNQNSLMQLFNGDRRIVHWYTRFGLWMDKDVADLS